MNHASLILIFLISSSFFVGAYGLSCGDRQIENCKECGKGNQSDACGVCEDNYFPLLYNLFCFACDDPYYGQEGCKGQCTYNLDVNNSLYVHCQNCKEGYYNKDGVCYKCDLKITGCSECSYNPGKEEITCLKCSTEEGYRLNQTSKCIKCNDLLYDCKKCKFIGNNVTEAECEECLDGYFLNSKKKCIECYEVTSNTKQHLHVYTCREDETPENCYCDSGYGLKGLNDINALSCVKCHDSCDTCQFNETTSKTECLKCNKHQYLDSQKTCTNCSHDSCNYCELDENNKEICLDCGSNKYIPEEKNCLYLPNCSDYIYDNTNKAPVCIECINSSYILDKETHQCINYAVFDSNLQKCGTYTYDYSSKKFVCESCFVLKSYYDMHKYAYINNTYECLSNSDGELYGCEFAIYNNESNHYECLQCKHYSRESFIKINANKSCVDTSVAELSSDCLEAEKKGEQYSCIKCDINDAIVVNTSTNIKDCYKREATLSLCLEGKHEDGNLICTKCVDNAILKDNKCSCNSDSFSKDNTTSCFKCNDVEEGNPACDESAGCEFANGKLTCKKCTEGHYENSEGECSLCSASIDHCGKCHYNNKVICDECINSVYFLNSTENKCILNDCDEYPEISPGCIICKDKLKDYKDNKKCQRCKYGYFKTKDEKCVYCSSEKYGGLGCYECGYETNEQDNITCKGCYTNFLSKTGKCYDCNIQFADTCEECQLVEDEGTETFKCVVCKYGYYLTSEGKCVSFISNIQKIPNCREYLFSSEDVKFKYITDEEDYFDLQIYNYSDYSNYLVVSETIYSKNFETKIVFIKTFLYLEKK